MKEYIERIAHAIYKKNMNYDAWATAQDHEKYRFYGFAEDLIDTVTKAGLVLSEPVVEKKEAKSPHVAAKAPDVGSPSLGQKAKEEE